MFRSTGALAAQFWNVLRHFEQCSDLIYIFQQLSTKLYKRRIGWNRGRRCSALVLSPRTVTQQF